MSYYFLPSETKVLLVSIWATFAIAAFGITLGLHANSQAIIFDGVFAVIDAAMTVLSLLVAKLLTREGSHRFQYGYWHLEPLVTALNGAVLSLICIYAIVNALRGLLNGSGGDISLGEASTYAAVVCTACIGLYLYQRRANVVLNSALIRLDMLSFLVSACITAALFLGFALTAIVEHLGYHALQPYADSLVLLVLAVGLFPSSLRIVASALREVFLIAPDALHEQVLQAAEQIVTRYGFGDFRSYVAKIGRINMIDIHILVPKDCHASVAQCDQVRQEIAEAIGCEARLDQWLSISFTTHADWI